MLWGFEALETWIQDVRYALRMMGRTKAFTTVVVLSLAIGIGANTAIFSVTNEAVFRSLPVPDPDELVLLRWASSVKKIPGGLWGRFDDSDAGGYTSTAFTYPAFAAFRERTEVVRDLFAFKKVGGRANVIVDGIAELATAQVVSGSYYRGLGVTPVIGRAIGDEDDRPGSEPLAVLSHGYWERRFGGAGDVVGRVVTVNGLAVTIAGVSPAGFEGTLDLGRVADLTLALAVLPQIMPNAARLTAEGRWWVQMMGRRAPGVTRLQVEAALGPVFGQVLAELPDAVPSTMRLLAEPGARGLCAGRDEVGKRLAVMAAVAGLVLLIACANVASLLLSRAASRRRELAVRAAIGAGRRRLLRQLLSESLLLAGLGLVAGLLLARGLAAVLLAAMELGEVGTVRFDWRVFGFTVVLGLGCGLLFGLIPALRSTREQVVGGLKEGGLGAIGGTVRGRLTRGLLVVQMALAVLLTVGAGLLLRTTANLRKVELGFDPVRLLVFQADPTLAGYEGDRLRGLYGRMLERVRALPGVESASLSQAGLVAGDVWITDITVAGFEGPVDIGFMTEEQQIADSYREERLYATLATTIGLVGALLAAIGLYGLLAYQVAQRTQELGVRMALGATRGALARLVLAQSFRLAAVGALLGLLASLAATRVLASVLFGLTATDPATLAGAILLLVVAALAGYLPARHAARVDPLAALRVE